MGLLGIPMPTKDIESSALLSNDATLGLTRFHVLWLQDPYASKDLIIWVLKGSRAPSIRSLEAWGIEQHLFSLHMQAYEGLSMTLKPPSGAVTAREESAVVAGVKSNHGLGFIVSSIGFRVERVCRVWGFRGLRVSGLGI